MAGVFDNGDLHAQANPEKRDLLLAGVTGCGDFPFDAPRSKPARHQDAVDVLQRGRRGFVGQVVGVDPADVDFALIPAPPCVKASTMLK
jgi:hypothetical protein